MSIPGIIQLISSKLGVLEHKLFNDYINLELDYNYIKSFYSGSYSGIYIKSLLCLLRVPFREGALFLDGQRDNYLNAILLLYDLDENLVLEILERVIYWRDIYSLWVKINKMEILRRFSTMNLSPGRGFLEPSKSEKC